MKLKHWQWLRRVTRPRTEYAHAFAPEQPYAAIGCGRVMRDPDDWRPANPERDGSKFCTRCFNKVEELR